MRIVPGVMCWMWSRLPRQFSSRGFTRYGYIVYRSSSSFASTGINTPSPPTIPSASTTSTTAASARLFVRKRKGMTLAECNPNLASEWHPWRNGSITPSDVTTGSNVKYWWKCEAAEDHEWQATVRMRLRANTGCPCCANRKVSVTNSFATQKPKAAALWHPTRNAPLTPKDVIAGTSKNYWFLMKRRSRKRTQTPTDGLGDPETDVIEVLRPVCRFPFEVPQKLKRKLKLDARPEFVEQWHPTKNGHTDPLSVALRSNTQVWWQCPHDEDHAWKASPNARVQGSVCPYCARTSTLASSTNSLLALAPGVAAEWHPTKNGDISPADVRSQARRKYWWRCSAHPEHEWTASPNNRVGKNTGCPHCMRLS